MLDLTKEWISLISLFNFWYFEKYEYVLNVKKIANIKMTFSWLKGIFAIALMEEKKHND